MEPTQIVIEDRDEPVLTMVSTEIQTPVQTLAVTIQSPDDDPISGIDTPLLTQ
jgi:hypothetical protein